MMLALGAGAATACSSVLGIDEPEVVPTILGAGADATSDGATGRDLAIGIIDYENTDVDDDAGQGDKPQNLKEAKFGAQEG